MIRVLTSHSKIWQPEKVVADVVLEYQQQGSVTIDLNNEGPCCDTIGLYKILDYVCKLFDFEKSKITIVTYNAEETHPEYTIKIRAQHWIQPTFRHSVQRGYDLDYFLDKKQVDKNLFGCLYNIPSWDRLCLLSYIYRNSKHSNILAVNGTWQPHQYNSYYLNDVTDFCPSEFANISEYLKSQPSPLPGHSGIKPVTPEHMVEIMPYYKDFFVDIVAETYSSGLSFFITEKPIRPIIALTPFVMQASVGYVETLQHTYGFKTFSHWWDESYDRYQNYERIEKIYKIFDFLDSLTVSERKTMYEEMRPVLLHNYKQLETLCSATNIGNNSND